MRGEGTAQRAFGKLLERPQVRRRALMALCGPAGGGCPGQAVDHPVEGFAWRSPFVSWNTDGRSLGSHQRDESLMALR